MGPWGGEGGRNQDLTRPSKQASIRAGGTGGAGKGRERRGAGMRKWQKNASRRKAISSALSPGIRAAIGGGAVGSPRRLPPAPQGDGPPPPPRNLQSSSFQIWS